MQDVILSEAKDPHIALALSTRSVEPYAMYYSCRVFRDAP